MVKVLDEIMVTIRLPHERLQRGQKRGRGLGGQLALALPPPPTC